MERLTLRLDSNRLGSARLFARVAENNLDSPPGTIDLHGLYVKEGESSANGLCVSKMISPRGWLTKGDPLAIERVDAALDQAKRTDEDELRIIVGETWPSPQSPLVERRESSFRSIVW